jgi:FixJ family two-component response regulator
MNAEGRLRAPVEPVRMGEERHIVLVVDDDQAVRDSLKFALELEGLNIHTCGGGADLLAHPNLADADCIVIDYQMPAMDGFEVIAALRAKGCAAPVILITGQASNALRHRAAAAGVRYLVEKPLLDSALVESIQDVLNAPQ